MLYKQYLNLFKKKEIITGFSHRLPDYATKYWLAKLEKAISQSSKNMFLDIGAGDGRLSTLLINNNFKKGYAIEVQINEQQWEKITNKYPQISILKGLLQENIIKLKNKNFDFILLCEVFEHIPPKDIKIFLKTLHYIIDENGYIFLTTPNKLVQGPANNAPQWYKKQPFGHHKHYELKEIKTLLKQHGFTIKWHTFECNKIKKK